MDMTKFITGGKIITVCDLMKKLDTLVKGDETWLDAEVAIVVDNGELVGNGFIGIEGDQSPEGELTVDIHFCTYPSEVYEQKRKERMSYGV